jgi:hypothetical protein
MAQTRINLVNRAIAKLQRSGDGLIADSADFDVMDGYVDAVVAQLEEDEFYSVPDIDDIDLAAFEWIADVLAQAAALEFRVVPNPAIREYAEKRLARLTASRPSEQPLVVDYF